MRAGVGPRLCERAELLLRAGCRRSPNSGCPTPSHQAVFSEMMHELSETPLAVAGGILDLLADLRERLALPCHLDRGEAPERIAGHVCRVEIRRVMAGFASHPRRSLTVGAAH